MASFKVIIMGSGLSGSLLGNGLMRNDIDFTIYERMKEDSRREGYQIRLGSNALRGMRACLEPDLLASIVLKFGRAGGRLNSAPVLYDQHFNTKLDLTKLSNYEKSAPINRGVLRDMLAKPLSDAGKMHYDKSFERYEILDLDGRERVRVWFADGSHDDCDILIGADGSHSRINRQLGLSNIKQVEKHVTFIAKSELPTSRYLAMSPQLHQKPVMTFADNKGLYFCAYLPDKLDSTPTKEDVRFNDRESSCMFGIHIPVETVPEDIFEASPEEKWQILRKSLDHWSPKYHEILDLIRGSDIYVYRGRVGSKPSLNWRSEVRSLEHLDRGHPRVWLMGDAMHAMLPSRGMGGNTAMRDTAVVLPLLVELAKTGNYQATQAVAKACKSYEDEMIPRSFEWVKKSGGDKPVPFDVNTWLGSFLIGIAKPILLVVSAWYTLSGYIWTRTIEDDAPELKS